VQNIASSQFLERLLQVYDIVWREVDYNGNGKEAYNGENTAIMKYTSPLSPSSVTESTELPPKTPRLSHTKHSRTTTSTRQHSAASHPQIKNTSTNWRLCSTMTLSYKEQMKDP
jgi:hypothetical protein